MYSISLVLACLRYTGADDTTHELWSIEILDFIL
jgi:hypothetical protein